MQIKMRFGLVLLFLSLALPALAPNAHAEVCNAETPPAETAVSTASLEFTVPGAITAFLSVNKQQCSFGIGWVATWHGNMTGWKRGTLDLDVDLYFNGNHQGSMSKTCYSSTGCTSPTRSKVFYTTGGHWKVVAVGCGPGGCVSDQKHVRKP